MYECCLPMFYLVAFNEERFLLFWGIYLSLGTINLHQALLITSHDFSVSAEELFPTLPSDFVDLKKHKIKLKTETA